MIVLIDGFTPRVKRWMDAMPIRRAYLVSFEHVREYVVTHLVSQSLLVNPYYTSCLRCTYLSKGERHSKLEWAVGKNGALRKADS